MMEEAEAGFCEGDVRRGGLKEFVKVWAGSDDPVADVVDPVDPGDVDELDAKLV